MRSVTQIFRLRLVCRSVLHANESPCKSSVPSWRPFARAEHVAATPLVRKVVHILGPRRKKHPFPIPEHPIFFRDACACPKCVDTSTSQKLFETADIPLDIKVQDLQYSKDGDVSVSWQNDIPGYADHTSTYTKSFRSMLQSLPLRLQASSHSMPQTPWDRSTIESKNLTLDYDSYINSSSTLHRALNHLHNYGLFFLVSVPPDPTSISTIATRIGPLQNTFYGPTWDVRSVPSSKNVAYTSSHLGFHMDLLYMADPPKVQVLHCMKASTHGGESLFTDALAAVHRMYQIRREGQGRALNPLLTFPLTYRYKNDGQWYQYSRPMIETYSSLALDPFRLGAGKIKAINWGPPFQAPCEISIGDNRLREYLKLAKQFKAHVEDEAAVFETKIDEGTCVVFDNRRVLHARRAFSSEDGERLLRGAYVGGDAYMSRLRMLNEEYGFVNDVEAKGEANGPVDDDEANGEADGPIDDDEANGEADGTIDDVEAKGEATV